MFLECVCQLRPSALGSFTVHCNSHTHYSALLFILIYTVYLARCPVPLSLPFTCECSALQRCRSALSRRMGLHDQTNSGKSDHPCPPDLWSGSSDLCGLGTERIMLFCFQRYSSLQNRKSEDEEHVVHWSSQHVCMSKQGLGVCARNIVIFVFYLLRFLISMCSKVLGNRCPLDANDCGSGTTFPWSPSPGIPSRVTRQRS